LGGAAVERRVDGGPGFAGVLWMATAFWGVRAGKWQKSKGISTRGSCSAAARERRRAGVLYRAGHGGGEVAAGGCFWGVWHGWKAQRKGE